MRGQLLCPPQGGQLVWEARHQCGQTTGSRGWPRGCAPSHQPPQGTRGPSWGPGIKPHLLPSLPEDGRSPTSHTKKPRLDPTFINMFNNSRSRKFIDKNLGMWMVCKQCFLGVAVTSSCSLVKCFVHTRLSQARGTSRQPSSCPHLHLPPPRPPFLQRGRPSRTRRHTPAGQAAGQVEAAGSLSASSDRGAGSSEQHEGLPAG